MSGERKQWRYLPARRVETLEAEVLRLRAEVADAMLGQELARAAVADELASVLASRAEWIERAETALAENERLRAENTEWRHRVMVSAPINVTINRDAEIELLRSEIERLRALTAEQAMVHDAWLAERNLADQLAEALGNSHDDPDGRFNRQAVNALAAWEEARRER